jgi:hypothetical protein
MAPHVGYGSRLLVWCMAVGLSVQLEGCCTTCNIPLPLNFVAGYIFHDSSRVTVSPVSIPIAIGYENCRIVNMQRPWKYYRKLIRDIDPTVKQTTRGYITTAAPTATQCFILFVNFPVALASKTVRYVMVDRYISAFA